ncbi:hypothetical protein BAE44_0016117 [Dichanthelium oligosanthes]|uniref:Uncharacterized protein n=1 Tax=Dichanthelium oligosanthes TaxID=888268 RepID=A0A1E5VCY1_9POAL|nr:hypothetical protein BAE44_0016117 [Dichanthelium oligosanthes]
MIEELKRQGLIGAGLCWTFFEMRVQPLKICPHFMWLYSNKTDPIRESAEELVTSVVAARLATVLEMKQEEAKTVFVSHPASRTLKTDEPNPLGTIRSYPTIPEDEDMQRGAKEVAKQKQKRPEEKEQQKNLRTQKRQARVDAGESSSYSVGVELRDSNGELQVRPPRLATLAGLGVWHRRRMSTAAVPLAGQRAAAPLSTGSTGTAAAGQSSTMPPVGRSTTVPPLPTTAATARIEGVTPALLTGVVVTTPAEMCVAPPLVAGMEVPVVTLAMAPPVASQVTAPATAPQTVGIEVPAAATVNLHAMERETLVETVVCRLLGAAVLAEAGQEAPAATAGEDVANPPTDMEVDHTTAEQAAVDLVEKEDEVFEQDDGQEVDWWEGIDDQILGIEGFIDVLKEELTVLANQSIRKSNFMRGEYDYFSRATERWRKAHRLLAGNVNSLRRKLAETRAWSETELSALRRDLDRAQTTFNAIRGEVARSAQSVLAAKSEAAVLRSERDQAQQRADEAEKPAADYDATLAGYEA